MLASGVILGVAAGFLIRRSWRPLASVELRWVPLLVVALLARTIAPLLGVLALPLYVFALGATAGAAAVNWRLAGAAAVAAGSALNLLVVLLNGGMPVDPAAAQAAGATMPFDGLHIVLDGEVRLALLSDVIPVALIKGVYSVGDVLIAVGAFLVPFVAFLRR
jgi:hypothetical protein